MDTRRALAGLTDAAERATTGDELFEQVSTRLRKHVPFDGSAWFATDPATLLATLPVRVENVEDGHCETYWEREYLVEDVLLFRDIARTETGVGTLADVTGGHLGRSTRHNEFLQPQGYDDELRATMRAGSSTWGVVSLFRDRGRARFDQDETTLLRQLGPIIATGLRRLALLESPPPTDQDAPGTALYSIDGELISLDAQAERWLNEFAGPDWMSKPVSTSIMSATLARARPGKEAGVQAAARLRTPAGRWLVLRASCLASPSGVPTGLALSVGPAKSSQIAPIVVEAYGLTPRERQITEGVARGLSNAEMADQMFLSPYTVRDHLKAIFAKVGVGSRGELVAKLFAEHYGPAMHADGQDGVHAFF
ncbi:MAG TPA: helix-turn-helix transcriptional regulator [Nocardioides sp.]|nr:helix-turn-helix transcriptional regulator [Nocardioides sp.]